VTTVLQSPRPRVDDSPTSSHRHRRLQSPWLRWIRYGLPPSWPLLFLVAGFPVFWALGLSIFAIPLLAVPMAWQLLRRGSVRFPPGFFIWGLFLLVVLASVFMLNSKAPGTVTGSGLGRYLAFFARFINYVAVTVVLLWVGNASERRLPTLTVVRILALLGIWTIVLGSIGVAFPHLAFQSPVGSIAPPQVSGNIGGRIAFSQVQPVLGFSAPRPAAPYSYTNAWGNNLSLLLPWLVAGWWVAGRWLRKSVAAVLLVVTIVPLVFSLNRGIWIGIVLSVGYIAVRLAVGGKIAVLGFVAVGLLLAVVVFLATPLSAVVSQRIQHGHSNDIRSSLGLTSVQLAATSPIIGYGSTRQVIGAQGSIAVGKTANCPRCGNAEVGSTGQLTLLLVAQGFVGVALYMLFLGTAVWRYRRDRSAVGYAGVLVVGLTMFYALFYTALTMPLCITFVAIGLLWRNDRRRSAEAADRTSPHGADLPALDPVSAR